MPNIKFKDNTQIGSECRPYIVAEVNSSHNGNMDTAKKMIDAAVNSGCNCVKFQSWSAESLYSLSYYEQNPIAKRFVKKFSLDESQLAELAVYCQNKGIAFASTPYSEKEVDFLVHTAHAPFIKVASMELNNDRFLDYIARTGMPIVLSTGMGDMDEIYHAVDVIEKAGNSFLCLLHCISIYPPEIKTINLNNIIGLKEHFPNYPIGFSDHSSGTELAAAAIALGACLIEKHLTLDKTKIGMDNQMATEPEEMAKLVSQCHNVYDALGSYERKVLPDELQQRKNMRRSLVYAHNLSVGTIIQDEDIIAKRPGTGFPPGDRDKVIGKTLSRDVQMDTLVQEDDFNNNCTL